MSVDLLEVRDLSKKTTHGEFYVVEHYVSTFMMYNARDTQYVLDVWLLWVTHIFIFVPEN